MLQPASGTLAGRGMADGSGGCCSWWCWRYLAGNCGKGPNMVLIPGEIRLRHVSTPADLLGILKSMNIDIDPTTLQATEVRSHTKGTGLHARHFAGHAV